jgi:hypothetical protein
LTDTLRFCQNLSVICIPSVLRELPVSIYIFLISWVLVAHACNSTWEAEIRRIKIQGETGQKVWETPAQIISECASIIQAEGSIK